MHGTCNETFLSITVGNTPIPLKTILGISNRQHESTVQGKNMSEITPIGIVLSQSHNSLRTSSKGCWSSLVAFIKGTKRSGEGRWLTFSQPSGNSSTFGKGIMDKEIVGWVEFLERINGAFAGVVMMVTLVPRLANALDKSSNGRV